MDQKWFGQRLGMEQNERLGLREPVAPHSSSWPPLRVSSRKQFPGFDGNTRGLNRNDSTRRAELSKCVLNCWLWGCGSCESQNGPNSARRMALGCKCVDRCPRGID